MVDQIRTELTPAQLFENNRRWAQAIHDKDADFLKNLLRNKTLNIYG